MQVFLSTMSDTYQQGRQYLILATVLAVLTALAVRPLRQWWGIPVLFIVYVAIFLAAIQRRMLAMLRGLPCPNYVPLLGHINVLLGSRLKLFQTLREHRAKHGSPAIWFLLNEFAVNISDADSVETMLSCTQNISKGHVYDFLHPWLGNGLLTATGQHWATYRKLLTPAFHFSILEKISIRLRHHAEKFAESLEELMQRDPKGLVDLMPPITKTTLAAILEVAMGVDLKEAGDNYFKATHSLGESICYRVIRPWLWNDFIYRFSPEGRQLKKDLQLLHGFSSKVIAERKAFFQSKSKESNVSDENKDEVGIRKKLAFLDVMLTAQQNGAEITDEDIRNQVDTFMFEGHDTTAMAIYWTLYLLADRPEIQERLREEVKSVDIKDTPTLPYLDRVIRESLRLYPSVPLIARQIGHPLTLGENQVVIPRMATIFLHVFDLHRDPEQFPDPLKFDPDREYPTHPFAYVPFSGGSRNCIGRRLAILELKLVVAATLRRIRLRKPPIPHFEVPIPADLVLRPGLKIKIPLETLQQ